jgi:hypothetical protein
VVYAPLVVPALPVYALAKVGRRCETLAQTGFIRQPVLPRPRLRSRSSVFPRAKPRKEIVLDPARHIESWGVRKGRATVYARFQEGVTIDYEK